MFSREAFRTKSSRPFWLRCSVVEPLKTTSNIQVIMTFHHHEMMTPDFVQAMAMGEVAI